MELVTLGATMRGRRILIAEDESHILLTLQLYLQSRGCEILTGRNGQEAWELLLAERESGRKIDLLLTDIVMPVMNGPELVEKLREHSIDLPVVVMTGYGDNDAFRRLMSAGCKKIVAKPFSPSNIENVIIEVLARCGSSDASEQGS